MDDLKADREKENKGSEGWVVVEGRWRQLETRPQSDSLVLQGEYSA